MVTAEAKKMATEALESYVGKTINASNLRKIQNITNKLLEDYAREGFYVYNDHTGAIVRRIKFKITTNGPQLELVSTFQGDEDEDY